MARKVFISFLGTSFYEETTYAVSESKALNSPSLRFIQEATINHLNSSFPFDVCYTFLTSDAKANWEDGDHINYKTKEKVFYKGLKSRLAGLNLRAEIIPIDIKDGQSTDEIWEIFETVFNLLQPNDHLVFDITHGFRSLPMLNITLINYAKLIKNIKVRGIFYGAFESKIKLKNLEYTPIWDLTSFAILQDWTNAASIFLKTGNGIQVSNLIIDEKYHALKTSITDFSKDILVNRGLNILNGKTTNTLKKEISEFKHLQTAQDKPLGLILEKIQEKFKDYQENDPKNGFIAVKWCIDNGLIQQAATILNEFIITYILIQLDEGEEIRNIENRNTASALLSILNTNEFIFSENIPLKEWQVSFKVKIMNYDKFKKFRPLVSDLKKHIRDDINHAGFRDKIGNYDTMVVEINKIYKSISKLCS